MSQRTVLSESDIDRALKRISHEIIEANQGTKNLVLLGIPSRGVGLAERIGALLAEIDPSYTPQVGSIDITMYRDDLAVRARALHVTQLPDCGLQDQIVVLVDDVLFSGRTVRAALDAINDYGRPTQIKLAVLVDRGHRELPIRADFVGKNLPTSKHERVLVQLKGFDSVDQVVIES